MTAQRILLTTTSFQDTPGPHHQKLKDAGIEIISDRGPLTEERMLELVGDIDGMICGDDAITAAVIDKALPRLKVISKYGIGLDKIDVDYATSKKLPVLFTPGVNHTTVAEHVLCLLLALQRRLIDICTDTRAGKWTRITGHEIMGSKLGIIGLGRIGKEVAIRAKAFGLTIQAYDLYWDEAFASEHGVERAASIEELCTSSDIVSIHTNLTPETNGMINAESIARMKKGVIIINCSRGEIVEVQAAKEALESGQLGGYAADVLDIEPPPADHPLLSAPNAIITSHIGSRTYESVQRQAGMACDNLIRFLNGEAPLAQANKF